MMERDRRHAGGERDVADRDYEVAALDVGKRTRTQRMPHRSREDVFAAALAKLQTWLPRLARAIAANDFDEAATMALVIRRALEDAHETVRADKRSVLEPLATEAAGLLAHAPELSDVALRERYRASDKRPSWDAERQTWLASHGGGVAAHSTIAAAPATASAAKTTDDEYEDAIGVSDAIKAKTMLPIAGVQGETFTAVGCGGRKDGKVSFTFDRAYVGERMSQQQQAPVRGVSVSIAVKLENCGDHPDVRFVQVERITAKKQGALVSRGPDSATSKARSGWDDARANSRGWQIDALDRSNNPFYVDDAFLGENGSSSKPGKLRDTPNVLTTGGNMGSEFRTCAVSYTNGKGTVLACIEWGYYLDATGVVSFYPTKPKAHPGLVPEVAAAAERWDALPGTMKVGLSR